MNDLYFFFKISRKSSAVTFQPPAKPVFCLFFRPKGRLWLRRGLQLPGPFRQHFLPQAAVPGTKAHPSGQLYRAAAAPHQGAQQLHIFFLCVPHGAVSECMAASSNRRIRSGKRAQPPHRAGVRAFDAA